ncbi:MAG: hypothetical protein AAF515_18900 [Pseudomonadota bacterium]
MAAVAVGETLLLTPPPAWLRTREEANDNFRLVEYLPAGHTEADWEERLTVESNALQPLPDPIEFLSELGANDERNCTFAKSQNVYAGFENGYPSAVQLYTCREDRETGRGRVQLIKAIAGREHFYVIERTRRSAPLATDAAPLSNQDMAAWSLYFRSVKLCDSEAADHPCPAASS